MQIETPCRDCVFAQFDGRTQTGCKLGRLDTFRAQGVQIDPATDPEDRSEAERLDFFVVVGRACLAFRPRGSDWSKKHSPDDYARQVRQEMRLRLAAVIPMQDATDTVERVKATLATLNDQTVKPSEVWIVVNHGGVSTADILQLRDYLSGLQLDFRIKRVLDRGSLGKAIDFAVADSKSIYYAVFRPGFIVPSTFIADIDHALNAHDRLERFSALTPVDDELNGLVVQTRLHQIIGGNRPMQWEGESGKVYEHTDVVSKITAASTEEGNQHMVKGVREVCLGL